MDYFIGDLIMCDSNEDIIRNSITILSNLSDDKYGSTLIELLNKSNKMGLKDITVEDALTFLKEKYGIE